MDDSLDGHTMNDYSYLSSMLFASSDVITITATDEKYNSLESMFPWYQDLPVTEFSQLQLRRLSGLEPRDFLVAVLCDQSMCCIGLAKTEDVKSLPILDAKGTKDVAFYQPSYMSELAIASSILVNLSFSHRPRDLIELLQILHCVETSLSAMSQCSSMKDIWVWSTLMIFERTFWDWENWAAQLQKDVIVKTSVIAAKAEFDSLTARGPSVVYSPPKRFSVPPVNEQPESRSKLTNSLCSILTTEWDSAMRTMNDLLVYDSLRDSIRISLAETVKRSACATAVRSATVTANKAARSAAEVSAKEGAYNAAWDTLWDVAGTEDDIIGRGGLAYIAECVAQGAPRSDYDSEMQIMRASPCASRPGWLIGCSAGWVGGWRAGRRAAMRFMWDAFGEGLPLGEWSEDLDVGWDAAWEQASLADRPVTRPEVGREVERTEYNVGWDDGWEFGWQAGCEAGWESGRDGAKLAARRSWRSARLAAVACGFDGIWDGLRDWEISLVYRKRLEDSLGESFGVLNVSNRRAWDSALETIWNQAWGRGPPIVQLACADAARQIGVSLDQTGTRGPEIMIWSPVRTRLPLCSS